MSSEVMDPELCVFSGFLVSGIWHAPLGVSSWDQINLEFGADVKKTSTHFLQGHHWSHVGRYTVEKGSLQPSSPLRMSSDLPACEEDAYVQTRFLSILLTFYCLHPIYLLCMLSFDS